MPTKRETGRRRALPDRPGEPRGFAGVRLDAGPGASPLEALADAVCPPRVRGRPLNILAVSGGAAGGAFGAGLLVGLEAGGRRPTFDLVTGVSTGALIAPFAFLGPAWDERLADAYTGGHAGALFDLRRMLPGIEAGLFRAQALDALIAPFVDPALLDAVAAAHLEGRRLFVATTDLDRQRGCIWDMGRIALGARGGDPEGALALFRSVLAASASLPGMFPPRLIDCEADGAAYVEMHADGGMAAPLFVLPEDLLRWPRIRERLRGGRVHLIVNTPLHAEAKATPANLPAVLMRSFETMLRFSYRQAISTTAAFCAGAGLPLGVASIPEGGNPRDLVSFDTANMRRMFEAGIARAAEPDPWSFDRPEPGPLASLLPGWLRAG